MPNSDTKTLPVAGLLPQIEEFLEDLLNDAGLKKTDPVLKAVMIGDLSTRLDKMLFLTIAKELNEQELDTFVKLSELEQNQAMAYLQDVRPEMPKIILGALAEFREIFLKEKTK